MTALLPLVFAIPLLAALLVALSGSRLLGRVLGLATPAAVATVGVMLTVATSGGEVIAAQVGGWPAGLGIPFAADLLSAMLLVVSGVLVFASMTFAFASDQDRNRWFVPLALVMTAGVYGAYLTADLFNLFVMVEVALLPSYVLMTRRGGPLALRATRLYLAINLTASTIFLAGLGAVYGVTGTVNVAALADQGGVPIVAVAVGVILIALSMKAAVVPVHTWLPATYPYASPAVTALFSGLLTKVGVYTLIRVLSVVYEPGPTVTLVVVAVTGTSMVIGVLGALGEGSIRGVLSFHMVSQVGYILVGLVLAGPIGMAAAVFYLVHHTVVKTSLFLTGGVVEQQHGTGRIARLGGVASQHRLVAVAFLFAALSLTGLPPFSGFWAKFGVLDAAVDAGNYLVFWLALLVSVGTLVSMLKVGSGVFWGKAPGVGASAGSAPRGQGPWQPGLVLPGLVLAGVSLAIGIFPGPLLELAATAGAGLSDPSTYVEAVLGR
ncbi:MAG: monovalent cation/H+ antiporter subunit D family protein [Actinomycetota bacterium]|nr:monovalent cation/H+ antiporter subunit D family protein [Actinomycetota bacterium]